MEQTIWEPQLFELSDGGRSKSRYPLQTNDCTVRALAIAFNLSYNKAYRILSKLGRDNNKGFMWPDVHGDFELAGHKLEYHSFPPMRGHRRMTRERFAKLYPKGTYIVGEFEHVTVCINGRFYDEVATKPDVITASWLVTREP